MTKRSGVRWKILTALSTALIVAGACLAIRKAHTRQDILGKIDPESGLRCRYTIAAGWGHNIGQLSSGGSGTWTKEKSRSGASISVLDGDWFEPPPPLPIQEWITTHLGHRPFAGSPSISQTTFKAGDLSKEIPIRNGFPEPVPPPRARLIMRRHLRIDGYPVTVDTMEVPHYQVKRMAAYLYTPDQGNLYMVDVATPASEFAPFDHEMQVILASFHIEKVAIPLNSKR